MNKAQRNYIEIKQQYDELHKVANELMDNGCDYIEMLNLTDLDILGQKRIEAEDELIKWAFTRIINNVSRSAYARRQLAHAYKYRNDPEIKPKLIQICLSVK